MLKSPVCSPGCLEHWCWGPCDFSCFHRKGQECPSGVLSQPALNSPSGRMARKTVTDVPVSFIWSCWLSLSQKLIFNSQIADKNVTDWNDSASYGVICRIICFYKNLMVMTSLKCKLNCKQPEPTHLSRTFNHLEIFQSFALREWRKRWIELMHSF